MTSSTHHPAVTLSDTELRPLASSLEIGRLPAQMLAGAIADAAADPDPANMYMRLFIILQVMGQADAALEMQRRALALRQLFRVASPPKPAIRLLALMGPGHIGDNAPLEFLLEHSDIRLDLLYITAELALPESIPEHDVAIVALGEADQHRAVLARIESLADAWPRPLLNRPRHIGNCARDRSYALLHAIPGLVMPATRRVARAQCAQCALPLTIRPLDTHGGRGLARIDTRPELDAYLAEHPESEFYVSQYVEYRSADGQFRKLRIALIDGAPYLCHMAIGPDWIVHYALAGMQLCAAKRAEEAAWMADFEQGLAVQHRATFAAIAAALGLDYVILDCALLPDARLLLFEADTRGWIHAVDASKEFAYKQTTMQKAFDGFRSMLCKQM